MVSLIIDEARRDTVASPAVKQNLLMGHAEWKMLFEECIKTNKSLPSVLYGCGFYTVTLPETAFPMRPRGNIATL